jgi:hypothetical protein
MPSPDPDTVTVAEFQAKVARTVTERQFQEWVMGTARRLGWMVHHTHDSRTNHWGADRGVPDLTLARGGRVLLVELKTEKGRLSDAQVAWAEALGMNWRVWRPSDWQNGTIEGELT